MRIPEPIRWQNWLTGDVHCEGPEQHQRDWRKLRVAIARAVRRYNRRRNIPFVKRVKADIPSGYRSYAEQKRLFLLYQAGQGNLAAEPGKSNHERGKAADAYIRGVPLGAAASEECAYWGIHFPVRGEKWHAELKA